MSYNGVGRRGYEHERCPKCGSLMVEWHVQYPNCHFNWDPNDEEDEDETVH